MNKYILYSYGGLASLPSIGLYYWLTAEFDSQAQKNVLGINEKKAPTQFHKLPSQDRINFTTNPNWEGDHFHLPKPELSTLKQVLLIHRHGDRTPNRFQPLDPLSDEDIWTFYGPGQITNRGKSRLYLLGSIIRERYDEFLGHSYNKNIRLSRSSGSLRCIESGQVFLASFLGLENRYESQNFVWNRSNPMAKLWQPAHIQSVPASFDGLLAEGARCYNLEVEYDDKINKSNETKELFGKYSDEAKLLQKTLGFKMEHFREWFWASSHIEIVNSVFPDLIDPKLLSAFPRIKDAGHEALTLYQSSLITRRLRAGLLVNDLIQQMKAMKHQGDKPFDFLNSNLKPFVHYSTHDLNMVVLLGILENWEKFKCRPDYASSLIFELHRDDKDDEWFIKLFYMPKVPGKLIELKIPSCQSHNAKSRCTLDKFESIMKPYIIPNWQKWMTECNNQFVDVDPYQPGI